MTLYLLIAMITTSAAAGTVNIVAHIVSEENVT